MAARQGPTKVEPTDWEDVTDWEDTGPSPTLLESRREASRMEFESNLPESTVLSRMSAMGDRAKAGITGLIGSGIDTIKDYARYGPLGQVKQILGLPEATVRGAVGPSIEIARGIQSGDYDAAASGAMGFLTETVPTIAGTAATIKPLARSALNSVTTPEAQAKRAVGNRQAATPSLHEVVQAPNSLAAAAKVIHKTYGKVAAPLQERLAQFMRNDPDRPVIMRDIAAQQADEAARMRQIEPLPPEPIVSNAPMNVQPPGVSSVNQQFLESLRQQPPKTPTNPLTMVEEGIAPTPARAKVIQMVDAVGNPTKFGERLVQIVPDIVDTPPGAAFDSKLMKGLRATEEGINAAEKLVPPETTINGSKVVNGLESLAEEYKSRAQLDTANRILSIANDWRQLGDSIPWTEFRRAKQTFFEKGGLTTTSMRRAYGILMEAVEQLDGPLKDAVQNANQRYSTVRTAIDAAGIDPKTGRRLKTVGKPKR